MLIDRLNVVETGAKDSVDLMIRTIDAQEPLSEAKRFDLRLVSMELLNNIFDYSTADVIELSCCLKDGAVAITIDDNGPGFDYDEVMQHCVTDNLYGARGRGIHIVRAIADEFRYNSAGNSVEVVLKLSDR